MPTRTQELWIFDKVSLEKIVYGEFENNFSCSLTLDQSRDSAKIIVKNFDSNVVLPNTICYMPTLGLWWIIANDNATRYASEESKGYWQHELQLLGAIEIFAHRDMINCGFNKDRYTLGTMLNRFNNLVDFELPISFDFTYYNENENIGYIKAFENYTPLSAIKEICNGINAIPKLTFEISADELVSATIHIIPKTGIDNTPIDIDDLDEDSEVKTINRSSYGSTVLSNAKNCVSPDLIRYPTSGGTLLSCGGGELSPANAYIKLPTNVDYVEKIILSFFSCNIVFDFIDDDGNTGSASIGEYMYGCLDNKNKDFVYDYIFATLDNHEIAYSTTCNNAKNELIKNKIKIYKLLEERAGAWCFYNGSINTFKDQELHLVNRNFSFGDINYYKTYDNQDLCMYWEQGKNTINNFKWFDYALNRTGGDDTKGLIYYPMAREDLELESGAQEVFSGDYIVIGSNLEQNNTGMSNKAMKYVVYYRPQVNVKLKIKNDLRSKDTSIYNQNGKLVDSKALSKLLLSYSNEIKSEEITRYKTYYSFNEVPSIGSVIDNNGVRYIINNLSLDFYELESDYFIKANITLTKEVACKSIMVSGNNNIRDYDCPQNYNVNREQIYRDYYEFDYSLKHTESTYYNFTKKLIFNFDKYIAKSQHMAFLKIKNNQYYDYLYFKKETIKTNIAKQMIETLDFEDNNIIGYNSVNNRLPVFNALELFNIVTTYQVPISYVDELGELNSISIAFVDSDMYEQLVYAYIRDNGYDDDRFNYFNYSPMIPQTMWEECEQDATKRDLLISESSYKKDGLEKPKFEFVTTFGNANGIIIGDDFLVEDEVTETNKMIVYGYVENDIPLNEDNWKDHTRPRENISGNIVINDAVTISYDDEERELTIYFYSQLIIDKNGIIVGATPNASSLTGKNISINKIKIDTTTQDTQIVNQTMLLGINNLKGNQTNFLNLYINNWKLK